ncbi:SAM-dependent methyltransferase [Thermomonospora umbrina]|uniref:SAM-dependent methyltransferase n=1 Tax=Thermomonospora umbrina TaxID=111806 RepID=UPI001FE625C9|nr:SAM-dependent methyltransferase [Thermomonospora umbrina]
MSSAPAPDGHAESPAARLWNTCGGRPQISLRSPLQVARFFNGLDLLEPGLVPANKWRADLPGDGQDVDELAGVALKIDHHA